MKRLIAALCSLAIVTLPFPTALAGADSRQKGFVLLLTVNTTDDHNDSSCDFNDCTLREAMFAANAVSTHDIINFSVTGVINLVAPLPVISDGVTIEGPGPTMLTVRRDPAWGPLRIFDVTTTEAVSLSGLTISNGNQGPGGGIRNLGSTLSIANCIISANFRGAITNELGTITVSDSTVSDNPDVAILIVSGIVTVTDSTVSNNGLGIDVLGDALTVRNSTISDNAAGGIINEGHAPVTVANSTISGNTARLGGGIFNEAGMLTVTNSTIAGNTATRHGGGIMISEDGILTVTNSTISGNSALGQDPGAQCFGGGIFSLANLINLKSSIIALNNCTEFPDIVAIVNSGGFNLIGKSNGSVGFTQPTDQTGTIASPLDPKLETDAMGKPLAKDNGGFTKTIALLSDSPAIDKGTSAGLTGTLTHDQRGTGFPRSLDHAAIPPATGGDNTDIGAFELQPPPINAGNALLINESCPPANGAIDPGERATVNLELMNTSNAATSNLVATLQTSGGVLAPSGPQSYGPIAVNSSAARDFSFTVPGNVSSGQTITATLQLQDGANNLGTVTFNFTAGPAPCAFVRLVVSSSLSRANASTVAGAITVLNVGSLAANGVTLTTAKLGATNGTPLPQGLGNLAPGASATVLVNFSNSTPGSSSMLSVGGIYAGGTFSGNKRVTIP